MNRAGTARAAQDTFNFFPAIKSGPGAATMQFSWNFNEYSKEENSAHYFRVQSEREQTFMAASLPACLPACLPYYLPSFLPSFLTLFFSCFYVFYSPLNSYFVRPACINTFTHVKSCCRKLLLYILIFK